MKKHYYLLIALFLFSIGNAQIINFPDANFKAKLLQPNVAFDLDQNPVTIDANNDGEIEVSEIQQVWILNISNATIADLTGISYFTNLAILDCSNNVLQNIVIDNSNAELRNLNCNHNLLQSISIDHSINLTSLQAAYNQLTASSIDIQFLHGQDPDDLSYYVPNIDLSYNNLTSYTTTGTYGALNCSHNPLTAFNLNGSFIYDLNVSFTSLSSIEGAGHLKYGNFQNCQFTLLDLTNISFYFQRRGSRIYVGNNLVDKIVFGDSSPNNLTYSSTNTFFDLGNFGGFNGCSLYPGDEESGNIQITDCPNLNFIDFKNGINYNNITCNEPASGETWTTSTLKLQIENCPNLSFMCVDEGEQDHIQQKINAMGLQNQVQVNSYCSFTPGGTFYTINGNVRYDSNSNGCDSGDLGIPLQKFTITDGTASSTIIAQDAGNYAINVGAGIHIVTPIIENSDFFTVSPESVSIDFPTQTSPQTQDFCILPNGVHPDLEISIIPVNAAVPGFNSRYKIIYKNKGTVTQSGSIHFNYDDAVLDFVSSSPSIASQSANLLVLNYDELASFETRYVIVTFNANSPMETPALNGGDVLNFNASIISGEIDETPEDNSFALQQTVVNSADPNDKTCLEGSKITPEMVGKEVHYMIRFENSGTANAQNIVVKDIIDTTKFDIDSLIPVAGSHPFVTKITGNKVEFIFENINLPFEDANNDGYVTFKIKTKPDLVLTDTFSNTASIYFDYNFPIVTNTATTTVALLAAQDFEFNSYFAIAPNPAANVLNIGMKKDITISSMNIYNVLGQLVLVIPNAKEIKTIDVSGLKSGNYFLKINADKGTSNTKFIKK